MELRIEEYQITPEIKFNFDELKNEIAERVSYYKDVAYTDDQMKMAKADRAKLRKVLTAIDDERKKVKADILAPYVELEAKLDEIKALIQEPINMIDGQIKEYEALQKKTKEASIRQTFENKGYTWLADAMWNPKWLNATYSMKAITEEIDAQILKYETDLKMLEEMGEYSYEAIEEYKKTLDYGKAMIKVYELQEQAKLKAKYEAEKARNLDSSKLEVVPRETKKIEFIQEPTWPEQTDRMWIRFEALMSVPEAVALKNFFEMNGIEFRKYEG